MEELKKLPYGSVIGALEYQSEIEPDKIAILYPDSNNNSQSYSSLTYKQYNNILNKIAEKLSTIILSISSDEPIVCGLLSVGGIEYLLCQYALLKFNNVIMFPISPRNSQSAIEHLLKITNTKLLITTNHYLTMIKTIQQEYLQILLFDSDFFQFEQLLKDKNIQSSLSNINFKKLNNDQQLNRVMMILHSSGSTAHPKAIYLTNRYFLISYFSYKSINENFWSNDDILLTWGPLYHLLAFNGSVRSIVQGCTYSLPLCVQFPPKPDELLRNIQVNNNITVLITVPTLLEQLIRELISDKNSHIGLKPLQKLKFVMYGGAGCPDDLCKTLVENNITLLSVYGSTETGLTLVNNHNPYDKRWKHMELPQIRKPFIRIITPENSQNPNEKIFIHLSNDPFLAENISNCQDGSFIVGDILLEDPPNSQKYLILGRQDDTLVHINGEKTNPLPIEDTIRKSPFVKQVVIIGHNQFCTAALIQLNIEQTLHLDINQIEENIWKYIEQANKDAPSHSTLIRKLVHFLSNDQILPVTDKGNLMRQKINQQYSTLISQIYDQFFNQQYQQQQQINKNKNENEIKWNKENIEKYLQDKIKSILSIDNNCLSSIFDIGINSLQVVQLRNSICQDICEIPKNFLYEYSSIDKIIEQLIYYLNNKNIQNDNNDPFHYQLTEQIIEKYIYLIKQQNQILSNKTKQHQQDCQRIFLLTGANGSLSNFIICDLLKKPKTIVKQIYCLIRGSNPKQRLLESFKQRELDISIINDQRLIILNDSMNLSDQYLGQSNDIYKILSNQITDIIHSAWKMNFNQTIKDFENDSIRGVFNLLKFSSLNNIQFHFISSIASAGSGILTHVKEEPLPRNSHIALPQGYGQSKYASEHISWAAMAFWNIPVNIYRVGQISGDTENGVWNTHELAPMMIYAGAGQLKKMPNQGENINWIPVNICSASIVDLALNSSFDCSISSDKRVYHLLNPNTITYQQYLQSLKDAGLNFDIISIKEFINSILSTNNLSNPLIKLSSFFEQKFINKDKFKLSIYQTDKTVEKCQILKNCPSIDSNLIKLYLNYWKKSGLLNQNN